MSSPEVGVREKGGNPRVLVAPDKFKGTLTASEAAVAVAVGVQQHWPGAEISTLHLADGGEGTVEAALAAGAEEHRLRVDGALGQEIWARWALFSHASGAAAIAVIESAEASGLNQVRPDPSSARVAHSYGCGQLIQAALNAQATEIVIGLGGSAMTDGGSGALRALGLQIFDEDDAPVPLGGAALLTASRLDTSHLDRRLRTVQVRLAVDVRNPLHGPEGAAYVFAEQKGADMETQHELEEALQHWANLLKPEAPSEEFIGPGSGAAGGFPSGFLALTPARMERGFDLVSDLVGFERYLEVADLLIVGEGSMDQQSLQGKAPLAAASVAAARGIPVVAVVGQLMLTEDELSAAGICSASSLLDIAPSMDAAKSEAALYAAQATVRALKQLTYAPCTSDGNEPSRRFDL